MRARGKVLPEFARTHNRALVLQTLFDGGRMSRADLARETGLTRVTISDLVAELIGDTLILEGGPREGSRPGKPAVMLDLNRAGHQIIGLDLSGDTVFVGAVLDLDGRVVERRELPIDGTLGTEALGRALALADSLAGLTTASVLGVGVGSPGIVDDTGVVLNAANLGWTNVPLQQILRDRLGLPVQLGNDARAAVLAEHSYGGAFSDIMLIKVGSGVGAGVLTDGVPLRGARSAAGEIGHVVVGTHGGPLCSCGKNGCLETWLAVPRLRAAIAAAATAAAERGTDPEASRIAVLETAGEHLGIALAPIVAALNLAEIVLTGPADLLDGPLLDATRRTLHARTLPDFTAELVLRMADDPDDVVLRGAAALVLEAELGIA